MRGFAAAALLWLAASMLVPVTEALATQLPRSAATSTLFESLGAPRFVCAPMVGQSELAFRIMARRHGCELAFTPMLHSRNFATVKRYRDENFDVPLDEPQLDRPLVAQFCGDDHHVVRAASMVQEHVDAIDLNLGCPQKIAKKGHYGAYLLEEPELVESLLREMVTTLDVPVTVKMRMLLGEPQRTLDFARMVEDTGAQMLTVHGRTVKQNKAHSGLANWDMIRRVREAVSLPVIANGGIETAEDALRCLNTTGAAGVMSSEALLENPALFANDAISRAQAHMHDGAQGEPAAEAGPSPRMVASRQLAFAKEYLDLAVAHPPRDMMAVVRGHTFKFLHRLLDTNTDVRDTLAKTRSVEGLQQVLDVLCTRYDLAPFPSESASLDELRAAREFVDDRFDLPIAAKSWYRRHREPASVR